MTVQEMVEFLSECDPDAEVLIASQPSYPLQSHVRGIATGEDILAYETGTEDGESERHHGPDESFGNVVYVVEAQQCYEMPYASRAAFDVATGC